MNLKLTPARIRAFENAIPRELWTALPAFRRSGFLPFEEARTFARNLTLKGSKEWYAWWKINRPPNISSSPDRIYKETWLSWGNWLGTGRIADSLKVFLPFAEARERARGLGLKSQREWYAWWKINRSPNIPSGPPITYKEQFRGWPDWLGTGNAINGKPRPSAYQHIDEIVALYKSGMWTQQALANKFVVGQTFVSRVLRGKIC